MDRDAAARNGRSAYWKNLVGFTLIVVLVVGYVAAHNHRYSDCRVMPGILDWPTECSRSAVVSPSNGRPSTAATDASLSVGNDVRLTALPTRGGCNTTFVFTASGSLTGSGTLVYRFEQSDGHRTPEIPVTITPDEGQFTLTQRWTIEAKGQLQPSLTFHLLQPVDRSVSQPVTYDCAG